LGWSSMMSSSFFFGGLLSLSDGMSGSGDVSVGA